MTTKKTRLGKPVGRRQVLIGGAMGAATLAMPAIVRAQTEVVVGAILPLTGPSAAFGQVSWEALQFGTELMTEAGGVKSMGGAKIKPIVADSETKPEIAATQVSRMVERGASVLIGCNQSAATIVASQVAERSRIPFLTAYDIDPTITARGFKYVFRCSPLTTTYSADLLTCIKEVAEKKGGFAKRLGLLSENSITGQGVNKYLTEAAGKLGFEVVETLSYDVGTTQNFAPFITKMKAANVDVLLGHNRVSDGVQITRTAKELGYNPKAMGGVLGAYNTQDYVEALKETAEHMFGTDSWAQTLKIPNMQPVVERFNARYKKPMDIGTVTILADIAVIWDALERAKSTDRQKLRDAIASTEMKPGEKNFFLLRGVKFSPSGDNELAGSMITQIMGGKRVPVWPPEIAQAEAVYPKPAWN
jgi:branched-chain amino acid transport system substrate-binding protein